MDEAAYKIEAQIDRTRERLGSNLRELEHRIDAATDWREQFRARPHLFLGGALAGGALLAVALRPTAARHAVDSPSEDHLRAFSRNGVDGREQALELWNSIKGALIGVASARITAYISDLVPGFEEHFQRAAQRHDTPRTMHSHRCNASRRILNMAEAGTLHDAFIDELRDTYDAERQLTKALAKLAKAAASPPLREAFESHLVETQGQIERLEQVFESLDEKVRGKHCDGIAGIIEEGKSIMEEDFDDDTMDACLIAAGQRAEHYEMAAYGTLVAWARAMGHSEAADLLQETLDEEKAADEKLSSLAEGGINQSAAEATHSDEDEEAVAVGGGARKKGATNGKSGARRR